MVEYFPDFSLVFFFFFAIDPQVLHDLEREYENDEYETSWLQLF